MIFIAGINTGRYGVKYSLYPAYTLMAIPVFGIVAAGVMVSHDYLVTAASAPNAATQGASDTGKLKYLFLCTQKQRTNDLQK